MAVNKYFAQGTRNEQKLLESLNIESIQMKGKDVHYIPRTIIAAHPVFREDRLSEFNEAFVIEMYFSNVQSFEGQGDLLTKFGIQIDDSATLKVSMKRWKEEAAKAANPQLAHRPAEGDLVYYPESKSLFKITKVRSRDPFFQLKERYVFTLEVSLVDYSYQELNTGNEEIDSAFGDAKNSLDGLNDTGRKHDGQNDLLKDKGDDVIDWSSSNPFGNS